MLCLIKRILGLIFDHGVAWKQILVLRQQIIRRRLVKVVAGNESTERRQHRGCAGFCRLSRCCCCRSAHTTCRNSRRPSDWLARPRSSVDRSPDTVCVKPGASRGQLSVTSLRPGSLLALLSAREVAAAPSAIHHLPKLGNCAPCLVTLFVLPNSEPQGTLWDDRR
jgi:hypothetical protein